MIYKMPLADQSVYYTFAEDDTRKYFGSLLQACSDTVNDSIFIPADPIIPLGNLERHDSTYPAFMNALFLTSNHLIDNSICCFHSVALKINGKGFLITGNSGTGKTTQYHNLEALYGNKIQIINGDKPFLQFKERGNIIIHPSPWKGKENYGSDISCSLKGIIFLRQRKYNVVKKVNPSEVVVTSLGQFLYYPSDTDVIHKVCELDRRLLNEIPLWCFDNTGDKKSSMLLYKEVLNR